MKRSKLLISGNAVFITVAYVVAVILTACAGVPNNSFTPSMPQPEATGLLQTADVGLAPNSPSPAPQPTSPYSVLSGASLSPDRQWIVSWVDVAPTDGSTSYGLHSQLKVTKVDNSATWLLADKWTPYRSGFDGWEPFHWSSDGRYMYFADWWAPDGCAVFEAVSDWRRVDLAAGTITEVVNDTSSLEFSPDGTTVAYISWSESKLALGIYDLQQGSERRLPLDIDIGYQRAGNIVWSPDGTALVFATLADACQPSSENRSIERVDIESLSRTTLIREDRNLVWIAGWPNTDQVLIQDRNSGHWLLNPITGELSLAATATAP